MQSSAAHDSGGGFDVDPKAFMWSSDKLGEAVSKIGRWHDYTVPLSIVVEKGDLGALRDHKLLLEQVVAESEGPTPVGGHDDGQGDRLRNRSGQPLGAQAQASRGKQESLRGRVQGSDVAPRQQDGRRPGIRALGAGYGRGKEQS